MSMQKNWDQLDVYQRLVMEKEHQANSRLRENGECFWRSLSEDLLCIKQKRTSGSIGFKSIPSAGFGAITGDSGALPDNYEVVGAGKNRGNVIAVPKGLSYSTATINGSSEIRSLNAADGVKRASMGGFKNCL